MNKKILLLPALLYLLMPLDVKSDDNIRSELNIYGFVRGDVVYKIKGYDSVFNGISNIPLSNNSKNKTYTTMTASRIGLDYSDHDLKTKIEVDFRGGNNNDSVRIRHAYINNKKWLIGQTTSNFLSADTMPETVDFNMPVGIGTLRTPLVRYNLENINSYISLEKHTANSLPGLTFKHQNLLNDNFLYNIRLLVQDVDISNSQGEDYGSEIGYGLALGLKYITKDDRITFRLDSSHLKGDKNYINYTENNYFLEKNEVQLNEFSTLNLSVNYKLSSIQSFNAGYGHLNYTSNTPNKKLEQFWINSFYKIRDNYTIGLEYNLSERETFDGQKGIDSRFGGMIKVDF